MKTFEEEDLQSQAERLIEKIKYYLITKIGRVLEEASPEEFYLAFSNAIREQIMVNWQATAQTWAKRGSRMIFYLSMEYLPGRFLYNNITNMKCQEIVKIVLKRTGRTEHDLAIHEYDPGLGNGGLGRLAACFLDSLATLKLPSRGYGLRYHYGLFEQQLWDGVQIEKPDLWLLSENPWEFRRDKRKVSVKFCGSCVKKTSYSGEEIYDLADHEEVFAIPYDIPIVGYCPTKDFTVGTLRLWTTKESPRNFQLQRFNAGRLDQAAENTTLTDVLYPSDQHETGKRIRLKQEFLLVSASLQDVFRYFFSCHNSIDAFADRVRFQINDTHPALLVAELMRILTKRYNKSWKEALEITQTCTAYTNHTILNEALEQWDSSLFRYLLPRQYKIIERINFDLCNTVRAQFPNDEERVRRVSIIENNLVRMANLAIAGSHKINGVAALHSDILKKSLFRDFYELHPEKFMNVTNGITHRRWLINSNPELAKFISERIGEEWKLDFSQITKLRAFVDDPISQKEFLRIKRANKERLLEFIYKDVQARDSRGTLFVPTLTLDATALFDVQVKRVHEYKRQLMNALHAIMLYHEILENPQARKVKRMIIFAGKAAASYETAKSIIRLINCIAKRINNDPIVRDYLNIVYIENYNVSRAEVIIPAADLSQQISTAGMEASGTGNMKFSMNGALTIGTEDGANIEMRQAIGDEYWPFKFGALSHEISEMKVAHSYRAWDIYQSNPKIKRAVDSLRDHSLVTLETEHQSLSSLYYTLLEGSWGSIPDRFFVLKDLQNYYETQKKVEELYINPEKWAKCAIGNIAGMGPFSTDRAINEYSQNIWQISPEPIDDKIFEKIYLAYQESVHPTTCSLNYIQKQTEIG